MLYIKTQKIADKFDVKKENHFAIIAEVDEKGHAQISILGKGKQNYFQSLLHEVLKAVVTQGGLEKEDLLEVIKNILEELK